jgi:hypothetical protein
MNKKRGCVPWLSYEQSSAAPAASRFCREPAQRSTKKRNLAFSANSSAWASAKPSCPILRHPALPPCGILSAAAASAAQAHISARPVMQLFRSTPMLPDNAAPAKVQRSQASSKWSGRNARNVQMECLRTKGWG